MALIATLLLAEPALAGDTRTWGQRLADSTLAGHPQAWSMRKSDGEYRWAYTQGLVTLGMYKLSLKHEEPGYYTYMKAYVDRYVAAPQVSGRARSAGAPWRSPTPTNTSPPSIPLAPSLHACWPS